MMESFALDAMPELPFPITDKVALFEFLYREARKDPDLLAMVIDEFINQLSDSRLIELEDFLVNNFGDD